MALGDQQHDSRMNLASACQESGAYDGGSHSATSDIVLHAAIRPETWHSCKHHIETQVILAGGGILNLVLLKKAVVQNGARAAVVPCYWGRFGDPILNKHVLFNGRIEST